MRTPPGISFRLQPPSDNLKTSVGKPSASRRTKTSSYTKTRSPLLGEPEERVASAAVAPATVEEVQQVVKVANQYKVPLYRISTGRNLGYGVRPRLFRRVVLDLKRMNRILEVTRKCFALVEPGVSYFDLYRYIRE